MPLWPINFLSLLPGAPNHFFSVYVEPEDELVLFLWHFLGLETFLWIARARRPFMRILSHGIFNMVFSLAPWLRYFSIHMTLPFPRPPIYYRISTIHLLGESRVLARRQHPIRGHRPIRRKHHILYPLGRHKPIRQREWYHLKKTLWHPTLSRRKHPVKKEISFVLPLSQIMTWS